MIKFKYIKDTTSLTIEIDGKFVTLPDSKEATPWSISEDLLIFHLRRKNDIPEENIVAINQKGEVIWKFNEGNYLAVKDRFVNFWIVGHHNLWTKNLGGKEYKLDPKTGMVLATRFENINFEYSDNEIIIERSKVKIEYQIKKVASWHGQILLVLYGGGSNPTEGAFLKALDKTGKELWTISHEDLNDKFNLYDGQILRLMSSEYTYDFNPETGEITNKRYVR